MKVSNMNIKPFSFVLFFVCLTTAYSAPTIGDRAEIRIWYSVSSVNSGAGLGGSISLINVENTFSDERLYTFLLNTNSARENSFVTIPAEGYRISIKIGNHKPSFVISGSAKFMTSPWIVGLSSNFGFSGSLNVCFPVLSSEKKYEEKDWFLARFNDTISLYCEYNYSQRAFYGTIKKYNNRQDVSGDPVITGDKYVLHTNETPFRLGAVVIHSSISEHINKQFKGIGEGYYGLTIGSYIPNNQDSQKRIQERSRNRQSQNLRGYDSRGRIIK